MITSDFRPEVEIRPFPACAMKNTQYNAYLWTNLRNSRVIKEIVVDEHDGDVRFETLHGPVRPYLFEPTAKPGAEWIKLPQRHAKLVLGSFDNINF